MPAKETRIIICPPPLRSAAIALVLGDLAPSLRSEVSAELLLSDPAAATASSRAFLIALDEHELLGAAWGQFQPGRTAVYWPPRFQEPPSQLVRDQLGQTVIDALDSAGIQMTQVLLPSPKTAEAAEVESLGFQFLADLEYLNCERDALLAASPPVAELDFVPYDESQRAQMTKLIERTYVDTLDCPALGGDRKLEDVLDGYRATGVFRPENWFFVRRRAAEAATTSDIGVLLLAEHPASNHFELMYMGLVPEARGNGWGLQIAHHAQRMAAQANAERIVLAVDAVNRPAKAIYAAAHFQLWDRRSVFIRFPGEHTAISAVAT